MAHREHPLEEDIKMIGGSNVFDHALCRPATRHRRSQPVENEEQEQSEHREQKRHELIVRHGGDPQTKCQLRTHQKKHPQQ